MKHLFALLALSLIFNLAMAQTYEKLLLNKMLGLNNISLGQPLDGASLQAFSDSKFHHKKKSFLPIFAKYVSQQDNLNASFVNDHVVYLNLDSLNEVASIIIELRDEEAIITQIENILGNCTHKVTLTGGGVGGSSLGWFFKDINLMVSLSGNSKLLVYYDGSKKSFFDYPEMY